MTKRLWIIGLATAVMAACGQRSDAQREVEERIDSEVSAAVADEAAGDAAPAVAGAPQVSATYQRTIDRAWRNAVDGETPAYACAGLKGRLMGNDEAATDDGREALFACNVLAPVRYFETLLDRVGSGETTCPQVMTAFMTQLPAMTLSVDAVEGMVEAMEADREGGFAEGLGAAVDEATLARGLGDPESLIKERLSGRVRATCPDLADIMLR